MLHKFHPGSKILFIPDPGVKKAPDPGPGPIRNTAEDREKRKDMVTETRIYVSHTVGVEQINVRLNLPELFVKFIRNLEQMTRTLA
jgi:hypothetical protein